MPRPSCKDKIIDAAEKVILDHGPGHLSLDLVAAQAGVSKGGLLYHFPSKDALLKSMLEREILQYNASKLKYEEKMPQDPYSSLKAGILACMEENPRRDRTALAILAAAAYNPQLLLPIKALHEQMLEQCSAQGDQAGRILSALLAADGLFFWRLLGVCPLDRARRDGIRKDLLELVSGDRSQKC